MNTAFFRRRTPLLLSLILAAATAIFCYVQTPSFESVQVASLGSDRVLEDRNGQPLQMLRVDFKKRKLPWIPLAAFPESLQTLLLKSEDHRFRYHPGVDPIALGRVLLRALRGQSIQGGSTLTMQLVDLIDPEVLQGHAKIKKGTISGKIRQIYKALFLELKWSKDEILTAYLNEIHLKGEFQGFPAFSYAYFQKPPMNLTSRESAIGVALISAPNQKEERLSRKSCTLLLYLEPEARCEEALPPLLNRLYSQTPQMPQGPSEAPHLARRLANEHKSLQHLHSTLDSKLQNKVAEILARHLSALKEKNVHEAAAIVVDNQSGEVLAYVGSSSGYEDSSQVDGITAFRQAGSTLKPFLYAKAFENRILTPASIVLDDPTAISWSGGVYRPANYDRQFNGPVSAREALASSLNVPAVKIVTMIGLLETYKIMQGLHLQKLQQPDFYGVSMALGAVDVQLETLTNAYRMLANKGQWTPLRYWREESFTEKEASPLFSEGATYLIKDILSDPDARTIGFGWDSPLETPFWTAVKTGTSKDYRDNWCVGFSSRYTVGVWAGNFNSEAMHEVSGVTGAGPAWAEIMQHLHLAESSELPAMPADVVARSVRFPWSTSARQEFFLKGTEPSSELIEPAIEKQVQIVFPAEGSVLVMNPHLAEDRQALFVRFKGQIPEASMLLLDKRELGAAKSPFKIAKLARGHHQLEIRSGDDQKSLAKVQFSIK